MSLSFFSHRVSVTMPGCSTLSVGIHTSCIMSKTVFCWSLWSFYISYPVLFWLCLLQLHTVWRVWDPWKLILPNLFLLQLPVVQQPILYQSGSTWSAKCAPHSMPSVHTAMIQLWLGLVLGNCWGYAGVSVRMADRKQHLWSISVCLEYLITSTHL